MAAPFIYLSDNLKSNEYQREGGREGGRKKGRELVAGLRYEKIKLRFQFAILMLRRGKRWVGCSLEGTEEKALSVQVRRKQD